MRHLIIIALLFSLIGCGSDSPDTEASTDSGTVPNDDPDGSSMTGLSSSNYNIILQNSLDLLRGRHYQELAQTLNVGEESIWGAAFSQPSGETLESGCPGGGQFSRTEFYEDTANGPVAANLVELELMQCVIGGAALNGGVSINTTTEASRQGSTINSTYTITDLAISTDEVQQNFTATLTQNAGTFGFRQFYTVNFQTDRYVQVNGATRISLSDASYRQDFDHQQDTAANTIEHLFQEEGSGVIQLSGSTNFGGSIEMTPPLVYLNESPENNPDWTHTQNLSSGNLTVTAIDGSSVQVSPDTGNPGTVNYLIASDGFQTLVEDFWFAPASSSQLP